jgi:hypothetical protein
VLIVSVVVGAGAGAGAGAGDVDVSGIERSVAAESPGGVASVSVALGCGS